MAATPAPSVSVIIPVYDDAAGLSDCLSALEGQSWPKDRLEVVVVDNGSRSPVGPRLRVRAGVRVVAERRPGSYAARNRGILASRGEILAFCDADCLPRPDWIARGVARLDPACVHVVGGGVELFAADGARPTAVEIYELATALRQEEYVERGGFAATANLFTYRSVFEEVGLFDDTVKSCGDVEWCQRATARGFGLVYAGDARVRHRTRSTWRDLRRKVQRIIGGVHDLHGRRRVRFTGIDRSILADLVPPFRYILKMVRRRELRTPREKLAVVLVILVVRYLEAFERIRLTLGGASRR